MTDITKPCLACSVGLYSECENPEIILTTDLDRGLIEWIIPCIEKFDAATVEGKPSTGGGGFKDPSEVGDPLSTGRKRAAMLMPIMTGQVCGWAGLKWAGGGVQPIVGCRGNKLAEFKKNEDMPEGVDSRGERHHGPDKAVLNNAVGMNLHGICSDCHHRWHELNNKYYDGKRPDAHLQWLPNQPYYDHDPFTKAEEYDLVLSEEWWAMAVKDRETYPIDLPDEDRLRYPTETGILTTSDNPFEDPLDPFTENGDNE